MSKYISFGQFNKKYFFILGTLAVRIIITFIRGFTPSLAPKNTIYIFGFKSNFLSHPMITYCFQYFSLCLGGIILELIFHDKKKNKKEEKDKDNKQENKATFNFTFSLSKSRALNGASTNYIFNDKNKKNDIKYFARIFFVYTLYYFAKVLMNAFDNMGFNRLKYWPLEFIFLYLFSKKILSKIFYTHQILSLLTLMLICTTIYVLDSFIPQSNKDCSSFLGKQLEECQMLIVNIYKDIIIIFGWYFIPIIILLYLAAMISNAYSSITSKWFMDIKYITLNRILIYLGTIGLFYSLAFLFVLSFISCSDKNHSFMNNICKFKYKNDLFYENYRTLGEIIADSHLYIDIFV